MDSEFFGAQRMRSTCLGAPREVTSASVLYYRQSQSVSVRFGLFFFLFFDFSFVLFFSFFLRSTHQAATPKGAGIVQYLKFQWRRILILISSVTARKRKGNSGMG